jgi:hypothetical protein
MTAQVVPIDINATWIVVEIERGLDQAMAAHNQSGASQKARPRECAALAWWPNVMRTIASGLEKGGS